MKKIVLLLITGLLFAVMTAAVPLKIENMGILYDKGISPTAELPVTLEQAKAQLKLDVSDDIDNELILEYIAAATDEAEQYIERDIRKHLYMLELEKWHNDLVLPKPDVLAVNKIIYIDKNGNEQQLDADLYELVPVDKYYSKLVYKDYENLPALKDNSIRAVTIFFETGMNPVPKSVGQAIKLIFTHSYENRSDTAERFTKASENKLRKYRIYS